MRQSIFKRKICQILACGVNSVKNEQKYKKFKKKYPALLKAEIEKMIDTYPDDNKFREDLRTCLRVFGGFLK